MKIKKLVIGIISLTIIVICSICLFCGCSNNSTQKDISNTFNVANSLANNQPTPTDLDYSLERYNLIRRAYWVNGKREKAVSLPCEITKPLGYIVLFTDSGAILGKFVVDGKVSSLNSWLTPDYYYKQIYDKSGYYEVEMPDIDGSYGTNKNGIFFFTTDGKYIEYTGDFLYSDIPFTINDPVLKTE